jgi:glycosyltransferase involved in cell wall biosynthesis
MNESDAPLVSVVTPVHNTAEFLSTCIESVLSQTYPRFEYIIVENRSTDRSGEVADRYASIDNRIRVFRTDSLLPQVANYNYALSLISGDSSYTKICQADDWLFPRCLEEMVHLGERHPNVGIVSSYYVRESEVMNVGVHPSTEVLVDGEACRRHLLNGEFLFGSPTSVLYRSDLVRERQPFYEEGRLHEDTELCFDVLDEVDFGFVHQVLSFSRAQPGSIMTSTSDLLPEALDRVIVAERYGHRYLTEPRLSVAREHALAEYYDGLARRVLRRLVRRGDPTFWEHHRRGLETVELRIERMRLLRSLARVALRVVTCPGGALSIARRTRATARGAEL